MRDLFLGRVRTWPNGRPVELALPAADTPEMAWLAARVFHLSERELRTQIRQKVFAGEMPEPRTVSSSHDCLEFARQSRGGLCVVNQAPGEARSPGVGLLDVSD